MKEMGRLSSPASLREAILGQLASVIDPETGADVIRMRLVEDLVVNEDGRVSYKFRPSSFLCPIALPLLLQIYQSIAEVEGVTGQDVQVVGYVHAAELTAWIRDGLLRNEHIPKSSEK
ncbi:MAG: iron-sulfur cluster assembly protein [Anaerolineae bacterium]